ncbi:VOC family protein [Paenibacillus sp. NPDC058071]|uniref:VOC family protein n=1 Tax=Paenibacillus sp. NPDC058071 TaxID=3346326 RepID=UPI0036DEB095
MRIERLDHLVLTVKSIDESVRFYGDVLGMDIQTFGQGRKAAKFGLQKINFQEVGHEIDPKADKPMPGSADFCLIVNDSLQEVLRQLKEHCIEPVLGPVERTGALGPMQSVYIRDPDDNLVELSSYGPHVRITNRDELK